MEGADGRRRMKPEERPSEDVLGARCQGLGGGSLKRGGINCILMYPNVS